MNDFLSWDLFLPIAKISFMTYLFHMSFNWYYFLLQVIISDMKLFIFHTIGDGDYFMQICIKMMLKYNFISILNSGLRGGFQHVADDRDICCPACGLPLYRSGWLPHTGTALWKDAEDSDRSADRTEVTSEYKQTKLSSNSFENDFTCWKIFKNA